MALLLETNCGGDLVIDLDIDGSPELCRNVLKLAAARFYTNTLIFSVTPNRFCQAGDPAGDGTGGTCIYGLLDNDDDDDSKNNTENDDTNTGIVVVAGEEAEGPPRSNHKTKTTIHYRRSPRRFLRSSLGRSLTSLERREKGRVVATHTVQNMLHTIGSQFLITLTAGPDRALDGYRTTATTNTTTAADPSSSNNTNNEAIPLLSLGIVAEDVNGVLDRIHAAYTDDKGRPYADIRIVRALVIYDPFPDPPGLDAYLRREGVVVGGDPTNDDDSTTPHQQRRVLDSPSPPPRPAEECVAKRISVADVELLNHHHPDDDQDNNSDNSSMDEDERNRQRLRDQETAAKAEDQSRAVVLEMLGDLPNAEAKAPEDVLFLCKLNPLTVDEDLELIFSRFDDRVKVEIIRDADTGVSLQYAFAEFSNKQAAVEAYFKMNNALVDDRRIKVDFSQSVAKLWNKYQQKLRMPPQLQQRPQQTLLSIRNGNDPQQWRQPQQQQHRNDNHPRNVDRKTDFSHRGNPEVAHYRDDFGRSRVFDRAQQQPSFSSSEAHWDEPRSRQRQKGGDRGGERSRHENTHRDKFRISEEKLRDINSLDNDHRPWSRSGRLADKESLEQGRHGDEHRSRHERRMQGDDRDDERKRGDDRHDKDRRKKSGHHDGLAEKESKSQRKSRDREQRHRDHDRRSGTSHSTRREKGQDSSDEKSNKKREHKHKEHKAEKRRKRHDSDSSCERRQKNDKKSSRFKRSPSVNENNEENDTRKRRKVDRRGARDDNLRSR